MAPTLGIALAAYNAERWIAPALESVLAQTSPAEEVIAVDDGSTDGTAAIIESFGDAVRLLRQPNRGAPLSFNRGFAESSCDYVALCAADDLWEPHKLEWQREALAARPAIDLAFGHARFFGVSEGDYARPPGTGLLEHATLKRALFQRNPLAAPTAVIRRELHRRLGGFREDIAMEDHEFWLRAVCARASFFYDPRLLVRMRRHGENLSSDRLRAWELGHSLHRWYAPQMGDRKLVRDAFARDAVGIATLRRQAGLRRQARDAYWHSLRYQPQVKPLAWAVALSVPGGEGLAARARIGSPREIASVAVKSSVRSGVRRLGFELRRTGDAERRRLRPAPYYERRNTILGTEGVNLVLDAGANVGQYVEVMRGAGYEGRVISFEPLSAPFGELERKAGADGCWEPRRLALSEEDGSATMNVAGSTVASSLLEMRTWWAEKAPELAFVGSEQVELRRLDSLADELLGPGDVVHFKLDVQGYELLALRGAEESLPRIRSVELEMSAVPVYKGQPDFRELIDFLYERGFELATLEAGTTDPDSGRMVEMDGIFVRRADA